MKRVQVVYEKEILLDCLMEKVSPKMVLDIKDYFRISIEKDDLIIRNENNIQVEVTDLKFNTMTKKKDKEVKNEEVKLNPVKNIKKEA